MGVKLLQKSQLAELKAKQKSQEIAEGLKVANRVDGLRELWAKTEQDFERYRTSTLDAINLEIIELQAKKEQLQGDLKQLKEQYDVLLPEIPLKREELSKFEKKLFTWERKLEKKQEKVDLAEIDIAEVKQKAADSLARHTDNERISRNILIQATKQREETQNLLDTAKKTRENAEKEKKNIESGLALRELTIQRKEKDISDQEFSLMEREKELDREKIKVIDMRETLQRSLDRIRQGRLA